MVRALSHSLLAFLLACIVLAGCEMFEETDVDPFEGQNAFFTVYGFLDASRTEQQIRVIPVQRTPENILVPADDHAIIDATVKSIDEETGSFVSWRHELTELSDGTYAHVFRTLLAPRGGRTYRIEVVRSDSATTSAATTVPILSSISQPIVADYDDGPQGITQRVFLPGIVFAADIEVAYNVSDGDRETARVVRSYGGAGRAADGGWEFVLDLSTDATVVLQTASPLVGEQVFLNEIGVRVRWADEQWPLIEGPIDVDILAQPGGSSNVVNGFGFVGSVGDYVRYWDVDDQGLKHALGFN